MENLILGDEINKMIEILTVQGFILIGKTPTDDPDAQQLQESYEKKSWKIFGKIWINIVGQISKIFYQKTNSIFSIGLR